MTNHFQRMKSCFGFKACRRFKSTTTPSFFIVKTLRNAKPSHSTKATQGIELPPVRPQEGIHSFTLEGTSQLYPKSQRKYLEARYFWTTSKYPPLDTFRHFSRTPHTRCKPDLVHVSPAKKSTVNGSISPPRTLFVTFNKYFLSPSFSQCLVNNIPLHPARPSASADVPLRLVNNEASSSHQGQSLLPLASEKTPRASHKTSAAPEHPL